MKLPGPTPKPDFYNIALDCVDRHARSPQRRHQPALLFFSPEKTLQTFSYADLQVATNRAANLLSRLKDRSAQRLILRLPNGPEFPHAFLGAIKAGLVPVPTSPLLTWRELEFLLRDSEAAFLVTTPEQLPPEILTQQPDTLRHILLVGDASAATLRSWDKLWRESSPHFQTAPTPASDPAYWLYTSGTSGQPKAVVHAHRSIRAHDARMRHWQDAKAGDVFFNTSALNWSYALTCGMLDVWSQGLCCLIAAETPTAESMVEILKLGRVTTLMSVPGLYRRLARHLSTHPTQFEALRRCLSAGEALPAITRQSFRQATGLEIYEGLGMTEHSVYLVQRCDRPVLAGSCGQALPGQRIEILRDDLSEAAAGETGILASHRSCEGLMLGYHRRGEEESLVLKGEWFLSGDAAYRDEEGNFFFLSRKDDVLNCGGYRVSPLEVEAVLNDHPDVEESAVGRTTVNRGTEVIQAFIKLKAHALPRSHTAEDILRHARERLAAYKVPRQVAFLRELPKTANGKLKRKTLSSFF